jgi:endo-1,4-beta-xylanase
VTPSGRAGAKTSTAPSAGTASAQGSLQVPDATGLLAGGSTLRALAARRGVAVGGSVTWGNVTSDPLYSSTIGRELNMVTPENEMKWSSVHSQPGAYNFANADAIVDFARAHGIAVRGHNLAWYQGNPSWLTSGNYGRDQLIAILRDHIHTVVGHFRGRVAQWDVVNEAAVPGGLRSSIWRDGIGPDYIDMAFRWAREADPGAKLFYNDVGGEGLSATSDSIYNLVRGLKGRGVPVDGVGFESHFDLNPPPARDIAANMRRLKAIGLEVAVTEMDVRVPLPPTAAALARQATIFQAVLATCLAAGNCRTFVAWGVTDRYTWVTTYYPGYGAPLLFDAAGLTKPAYDAVKRTLSG